MQFAEFEQFRMEVLRDPALQQRLIGLGSRKEFVKRVVETGAERGFEFTGADVEAAMQASHAEWVLRWV
jgi:hypothetical protein